MAHFEQLPTVTLDDLVKRTREIVSNLHGAQVIIENGQPIATLLPQPGAGTLEDLESALDAMHVQVEMIKESMRQASSVNIAVEEFHYPTR